VFSNAGTYSVTLSNQFGIATNSYIITVAPLLITVPPRSQTAFGGATITFDVTAMGANLSYQWQFNGTNIVGASNRVLSLTNVLPEVAGTYAVVVSNSVGTVLSPTATLDVISLGVTLQPASQTVFGGESVTFGVESAALPLSIISGGSRVTISLAKPTAC
jgi:hypothetical protein